MRVKSRLVHGSSLYRQRLFEEPHAIRQNRHGEAVMAMTHEGHYYERVTASPTVPGPLITGADYRGIGRAMADCLIDYFALPPTPASIERCEAY